MKRLLLPFFVLALAACGQERYAGPPESRWSEMMDCRQAVWVDRGGPVRALAAGFGAGLGGAAGGALAGAALADTSPIKYSDAVDRCMAMRGYAAMYPNPADH